jgi:hypothetical protein
MNTKRIPIGSRLWKAAASAALVAAALVLCACSAVEVNSRWNTQPVAVNGIADEWKGELVQDKDKGISFGTKNDGKFLYICVVGDTPMLRGMALSRGMTVWLDAAGGKAKTFGIKFPLGAAAAAQAAPSAGVAGAPAQLPAGGQPAAAGGGQRAGGAGARPTPAMTDVIIIGPEKGASKQIPVRELKGIEVRAAVSQGVFAYELKVPLVAGPEFPYAIGPAAGGVVGVGIEIPAMHQGGGGGDMGGGGMRGGMGGLFFWAKVVLAKG